MPEFDDNTEETEYTENNYVDLGEDFEETNSSVNLNNDTIMENFNIDDEEDYEVPEKYYIDVEKIVPGFIGWVKYGGDFLLGKVISRNKKKKTAYVKFFSMDGLGKAKQLVSLVDIFDLEYSFNEFVLGEDEPKRVLFSLIMEEVGEQESNNNEPWYMF